jgi:dCTP diphosphatase
LNCRFSGKDEGVKSINVEKINEAVTQFIEEREWDQFHSIKNLSMALSVETSELLEIFQWLKESESNLTKDNPDLKAKVAEEIADIFIYLMRIAIKSGVNIEEAALNKIKKNADKYPASQVRGSSKKYTEY